MKFNYPLPIIITYTKNILSSIFHAVSYVSSVLLSQSFQLDHLVIPADVLLGHTNRVPTALIVIPPLVYYHADY